MLNILHVITAPCGGGAEVLVRELVSRMNDNDVQSSALYFNTNSPCAKNLVLEPNESSLNVGFRDPKAILLLRGVIKKQLELHDNLIVHVHLIWPMLFVSLAVIGLPVKLVYTEHATSNSRRKYPLLRYIEKLFYRRFERVVCISAGTKLALDQWLGSKLAAKNEVIFNGSRLYSVKVRRCPNNTINFISIGSLVGHKGFDRTIRALAEWRNKDWQYLIVGEGHERHSLETLIATLELSDKIKLIGWSDQIEQHLHTADIQLVPSHYEGFGLAAVEGMSTGLPIIAANVSGLNEVLAGAGQAGYLVDNPDSDSEWLDAIELGLTALQQNTEQVVQDARNNAEQFSLDRMVKNYKKAYFSLGSDSEN
ncbi:glycosyltransferase [Marinomonas shanghaiensis]|uniref:glycosyltransferase n=1 Tax=Marinomonas shanghaiensis TaxID=2202418 RepID=UPI000DB9D389|nr:glycosyltransferase [Marinomonas shanghaiensis]